MGALILKGFTCYKGSFLSVSSNIRNVFKHLTIIMVQTGNCYPKVHLIFHLMPHSGYRKAGESPINLKIQN